MKRIAKQAAKKIQKESLETLKTAKRQVAGSDLPLPEPSAGSGVPPEEEVRAKQRDLEKVRTLEREMGEIRKQKEQKEEEKLRQETLEGQRKEEEGKAKSAPHLASRPSRRIATGMKGKLSKLKRKAEIRMPPSG